MADEIYYNLELTGATIKERLADVETLNKEVEAIGQYNGEIEQGKGYIGSLQRDIKNVGNEIKKLDTKYVANTDFQSIKSLVGTQGKAIETNEGAIATLKAQTIGNETRPGNIDSLQTQINSKVSQSNFETFQKNIGDRLVIIENKNSEQDATLTAIGRIKIAGQQEGSGELLRLQEIIEDYQTYINTIDTLNKNIKTLKEQYNALQIRLGELQKQINEIKDQLNSSK